MNEILGGDSVQAIVRRIGTLMTPRVGDTVVLHVAKYAFRGSLLVAGMAGAHPC